MFRNPRYLVLFIAITFLLSSCSQEPDHRRLIPKDAAVVAGINLRSLSKTIAWNAVTGSKLFKEMQKRMPQKGGTDLMSGVDKAGIDALNTFYVYLKTDKRFNSGIKVTGLVPLSSASEWEVYVKNNFPQAEIVKHNDLKVACIGGTMCVAWNSSLLIIMNALELVDPGVDAKVTPEIAAEFDGAFNTPKENSIKENAHFQTLENVGHDLTLWINYEQIMNQYVSEGKMGPVSLSPDIWKETALSCGFDFRKGKITGDIIWNASKEMDSVYRELGATVTSKDLVSRLPAKDLDMMVALHISPKGIKTLLTKTELLGLVNLGLSAQGMDADQLLDAFTGDIAFTMNSLNVQNIQGIGNAYATDDQKPNATMSYVMKINKKENFQKIIAIADQFGELHPIDKGYFIPLTQRDTLFLVINDAYLVTSNKYATAVSIVEGANAGNKLPEVAQSRAVAHPFSLYFDIQQASKKIDLTTGISRSDAGIYEESKKLLKDVSFYGGDYKNGSMEMHLEINFMNTEESSIFTLLDFGMKVSDAMDKANKSPVKTQDSVKLPS